MIKLYSAVLLLCISNVSISKDQTTTGFWQEWQVKTAINKGVQRSGQQVYDFKCYECHTRNTQGAPMPGDNYEWGQRYKKGFDVLMKHALEGFNRGVMPIRGGCRDCSEKELENAVIYMLNQSGIEIGLKDK